MHACTLTATNGKVVKLRLLDEPTGYRAESIKAKLSFQQLREPKVVDWLRGLHHRMSDMTKPLTIEVD